MKRLQQLLGCRYWFEAYILKENLNEQAWRENLLALTKQSGFLRKLKVAVQIKNGIVRYFIGADKDISILSNSLEGILLRPVKSSIIKIPSDKATKRERFVQFITGGNLLDVYEAYQLKRGKELTWTVFTMQSMRPKTALCTAVLYFKDTDKSYSFAQKKFLYLPGNLLAINFQANTKYLYKKQPKYLDIQKSMHILRSDENGALLKVDTFPYMPKDHFISLASYDFDRHSFIVGASGSGKSKFISLFVDKLFASSGIKQSYRVVIIDPHASLEDDLRGMKDLKVVNFKEPEEGAELFAGADTDISAATELTGTLFKSLLADQFNPKLERLLRFSLFVLMTAQVMSLENLKRLVTDLDYRNKIINHVHGYVPPNIITFFGADFNELRAQSYNEAIAPIVALVDEIQLQPALAKQNEHTRSLAKLIVAHRLTLFSLNRISMGEKVVKTIAGLLIQQLFLLAQARTFNEKVILIIDEVSIVQNPALAQILAEARKYNLFVFLTQQYFGQVDKSLQAAVFANVTNYYVFRVSEEDARLLEGNLTMELPRANMFAAKEAGGKESGLRIKMLSSLSVQECIVRVSSEGQLLPALKAKTMPYMPPPFVAAVKLKAYDKPRIPVKFSEHQAASAKRLVNNKSEAKSPVNLAEFLASQSSSRKVLKKEKN